MQDDINLLKIYQIYGNSIKSIKNLSNLLNIYHIYMNSIKSIGLLTRIYINSVIQAYIGLYIKPSLAIAGFVNRVNVFNGDYVYGQQISLEGPQLVSA